MLGAGVQSCIGGGVAAIVLAAAPALAQEGEEFAEDGLTDEFALLEDAAVVESAARHKQEIGMSPSAVTVLTREDIETSGASTLPDLLRLVPGMDVIVSSPMFSGLTSRLFWSNEGQHYLVLIDGRDAGVEAIGLVPWTVQPLFLEEVERIEIIRGPGSSLYGANAMSGVISITTRAVPEENSGWVQVGGGEVGSVQVGVRVTTRARRWGFSLGGGGELSNGFESPRTRAKRVWKFRGVVEYRISDSQRMLLEAAVSEGKGPFTTPVGMIDATFGHRNLRLAYESEDMRGQLYWFHNPVDMNLRAPLDYAGIRLAMFTPFFMEGHNVVGDFHWSLPRFWEPLLLIAGAGGRVMMMESDKLLNAETFTDPASPDYHRPGLSHWEGRAGAFVHAELSLVDWMTATFGLRFDYNTETEEFLSPRLAVVFKPASGQFVRLGVARAFRKPAYIECGGHLMVSFPDDSPLTGTARDNFQEFMTRVLGNRDLGNEQLLSFEVGYLGRFLDSRLTVTLDLYCNLLRDVTMLDSHIVPDEHGLPDLNESYFHFINGRHLTIYGSELGVRFNLSRSVSLVASWAHRQSFLSETGESFPENPKNLLALGGRFRTDWGLLGSVYAFYRSEFWDKSVENPDGLLEPVLEKHLDDAILVLARIGWGIPLSGGLEMEVGARLFLPVPFSPPYFRYREEGGGVTPEGIQYGGQELRRVVSGYLQGSF
jgi:iron complex outermembrane receptor protein